MQSERTRSGFLPDRTIHLHPTQTCNLACAHCYSESGPRERATLSLPAINRALWILRAEGYTHVSLSGGEPTVYPALLPLIGEARSIGYRVTMITNGLISPQLIDDVATRLDGIAISFDGLAARHDAIRGRQGAFARATETLARLAAKDAPVAAAISVTREAIPELPDLVDHLLQSGARALQIRPVALAGRARSATMFSALSAADQARLFLVVLALRDELQSRVPVQCDLVPARNLWQQRDDYAALAEAGEDEALSSLVNPLVITSAGAVKPMTYDFEDSFNLTTIDSISQERLDEYKRGVAVSRFRVLVAEALDGLRENAWFVDWFDHCARLSHEIAAARERPVGLFLGNTHS